MAYGWFVVRWAGRRVRVRIIPCSLFPVICVAKWGAAVLAVIGPGQSAVMVPGRL
jgi:hypothetical protein